MPDGTVISGYKVQALIRRVFLTAAFLEKLQDVEEPESHGGSEIQSKLEDEND